MVYSDNIAKYARQPIQFVRITLDRCTNVFDDSGSGGFCTASGTPICHYSYHTCRDRLNYKKGSRAYRFQSKGAPLLAVAGVIPSLVGVSALTTKIDPKRSLTIAPRFEATFDADWGDNMPHVPVDVDKGSGKYNTDTGGEWWKNLFNRNANFRHKEISFYEGFPGDAEADLQEKFHGIIENVEYMSDGRVKVTATHSLRKLDGLTIPNAVRSTNVTTLELSSEDTTIKVVDASEFKMFPARLWALWYDSFEWKLFTFDKEDATSEQKYSSSVFGGGADMAYVPKFDSVYVYVPAFMAGQWERIDIATGSRTFVSGATGNLRGMAYDPVTDVMYSTDNTNLYSIVMTDIDTLVVTAIGPHGVGSHVEGLAFDPITQTLYGISDTANNLYTINTSTGAATLVGSIGSGQWAGLAYDGDTDTLYTYDAGGQDVYAINPQTAVTTLIGDPGISGGNLITGLTLIGKKSYVKIEDKKQGHEYLELNGKSDALNELYVVRNALYGTNEHSHGLGVKVIQVAPFLDRADYTGATGINAVDAMIEILMDWLEFGRDDVDVAQFELERSEWYQSVLVKRIIEKPIKADKLLNQLRKVIHADIFQAENRKITFQGFHPRNEHLEVLPAWNGDANILNNPRPQVDLNVDAQLSQVVVYYNPANSSSTSKDPKDFDDIFILKNADIESVNNFNESYVTEIFMPWIYREQEAKRMARQILRRFKLSPARYKVSVDVKDYTVQTGDLVNVTTPDFLDVFGSQIQTTFQVLHKSEKGEGIIGLELLETKFTQPYGFIAHNGAADHGAASAEEKFHAYIGTGVEVDSQGNPTKAQMGDGKDGYYTF